MITMVTTKKVLMPRGKQKTLASIFLQCSILYAMSLDIVSCNFAIVLLIHYNKWEDRRRLFHHGHVAAQKHLFNATYYFANPVSCLCIQYIVLNSTSF